MRVEGDRLLRIVARLQHADGDGASAGDAGRLCSVAADVTAMTGAGVMVMTGSLPGTSVCSSDAVSARLEDLQYTLGEGPCVDAFYDQCPVLEPDLAAAGSTRWSAFGPPALETGARAVFGFPMHIGAVAFGSLNLYRVDAGPMTGEHHADALVMAGVAAHAVLAMQAGTPPGLLGESLERAAALGWVVHQAAGMVSAQLEVDVAQAMVRLRARAFADDRPLADLSRDVVDRRVRF